MNNEEYLNKALGIYKSAKTAKILQRGEQPKQRKHEEADLHLEVCKEVKNLYPFLHYVRHERERARSKFSGQLMGKYNTLSGVPDFEIITPRGNYHGMYLEFKKPGKDWLKKGKVDPEFAHQYNCHLKLWELGKPAYFCNDVQEALRLIMWYVVGEPEPKQLYQFTDEYKKKYLVDDASF